MKTFITACAIMLSLAVQAFAGTGDIQTEGIKTSTVQEMAGYTTISIKLKTSNRGEASKVFIKYRARDFGGYELSSGILNGTLQKHETKDLTSTIMLTNEVYNRVHKWEVKQIDAYPDR